MTSRRTMISKGDGVYQTATGFIYRQIVPEDVKRALGVKDTEWRHKLPGDLSAARRQALAYRAQYQAVIDQTRAEGPIKPLLRQLDKIAADAQARIAEASRAFYSRPRDVHDDGLDRYRRSVEREADARSQAVTADLLKAIEKAAAKDTDLSRALKSAGGAAAAYKAATYDAGLAKFIQSHADELDAEAAALDDDESDAVALQAHQTRRIANRLAANAAPAVEALAPLLDQSNPQTARPSHLIDDVEKARWIAEALRPETTRKCSVYMRRWNEIHGAGMDVKDITSAHMREYRDTVAKLTATRDPLPVSALLTLPGSKLTAAAVGKHVHWIKSLLAYAYREEIITENPAGRVRAPKDGRAKADRKQPFTAKQVKDILALVDTKWSTADNKKRCYRWITVLCAYTGARVNEIGRLFRSDVTTVDGVAAIKITDRGEGQSVKNAASVRTIPIPQAVLDLGFLDFVAKVKTERLFAAIDATGKTGFHFNYGTRASNALRDQVLDHLDSCKDPTTGARDDRLSMHSFRHRWIEAARAARVEDYNRRCITGHSHRGDVAASYGGAPTLARLKEDMDAVKPAGS